MGAGGKQTVGYRYYMGLHMGICHGPVDAVLEIRVGDRTAWSGSITSSSSVTITQPDLFGGEKKEGGISGTLDVMMGESTQAANSYLSLMQTGLQTAYRGLLSLVWRGGMVSANNPYIKPWAVRVRRLVSGWDGGVWYSAKATIDLGSGLLAANPAHIIYECLTNRKWGRGFNAGKLDLASFTAAADTFHAEGMGLCFEWNRPGPVNNIIQMVCDHAGAAVGEDPSTGLIRLKALRADYTVGALPVYSKDAGNIISVDRFDRSNVPDSTNEITTRYTDQATGKEGSVTVQNLAAVQARGGVNASTRAYLAFPTASLALRAAYRDLKASTSGLARMTLTLTRAAFGVLPGDVLSFSDAGLGFSQMPIRVGRVDYGQFTDGRIVVDAVQDVFGMPATTYVAPQSRLWIEPDRTPAAAPYTKVMEVPYRELARTLGPSNSAGLDPNAGYLAAMAARPTGVSINYELHTKVGAAAYALASDGEWCPHGATTADINETATTVTIAGIDLELVEVGTAGLIDNEIIKVTSIDPNTGVVGIGRGCADTVPAKHTAGARLWFFEVYAEADPTEYATGEVVDAKMRTRTSAGLLAEGSSPSGSVTIAQRAYRPYPPGDFKINGSRFPTTVFGYDSITLTGVHRDRLLQQDQLLDTLQGAVGPEAGTTYNAEVREASTNAIIASSFGLSTPTAVFSYDSLGSAVNLLVKMWSSRGGLDSAQSHATTVQRVNADGTPYLAGSSLAPSIDMMIYDGAVFLLQKRVGSPNRARVYRSTDGITFEFSSDQEAVTFPADDRGMAYSGSLYVGWPSYGVELAAPYTSYYSLFVPRLTISSPPSLIGTQSPISWVASTSIPLAIAWDAANSRFVMLSSDFTVRSTTDGSTWSNLGTLTQPGFTLPFWGNQKLQLWKEGSNWYLLEASASGGRLMYSTGLLVWSLCPGVSLASPPAGVSWTFMRSFAATSRGTNVVVVGDARRTGAGELMKNVVLRSTDGINFTIAYESADLYNYTEVKPFGATGFVASGPGGVLVSNDNGATWTGTAMATPPTALRSNGTRVVASRRTRAVAGGFVNEPWYTDDGTTWMLCTVREYRTGSHQHWRLKIQENGGGSADVYINELKFFNGVALLTGYTKSAGSNAATIGGIDDASDSTNWSVSNSAVLAGDAWAAYDFGSAVTVTAIELKGSGTPANSPKRIEVQWSDDGTVWHSSWYEDGLTWTANENKQLKADDFAGVPIPMLAGSETNLFVASKNLSGTYSYYDSTDGVSWTLRTGITANIFTVPLTLFTQGGAWYVGIDYTGNFYKKASGSWDGAYTLTSLTSLPTSGISGGLQVRGYSYLNGQHVAWVYNVGQLPIFITSSDAVTWTDKPTAVGIPYGGFTSFEARALFYDTTNSRYLLAGNSITSFVASGKFYTSTDLINWSEVAAFSAAAGANLIVYEGIRNGSTVLIAARDATGLCVLRSTDNGTTWSRVTLSPPSPGDSGEVSFIVWDGTWYVMTGRGFSARSSDGSSWAYTDLATGDYSLSLMTNKAGAVMRQDTSATGAGGLFRTINGGSSWTAVSLP